MQHYNINIDEAIGWSIYKSHMITQATSLIYINQWIDIFFFSFQYKNCPVFVWWALLRKYVIGNKSPILRGLLPRLIVPNGNKWNSCPLLMICCQPISSMVIAHSKENGSVHRNIIVWRFSTHIWGRRLFF